MNNVIPFPAQLMPVDAWGRQAPPGYGFTIDGQLVRVPYPVHGDTDPNIPWGFGHPLHDALFKGEATIEVQPGAPIGPGFADHRHFALVPKAAYANDDNDDDTRPSSDMGTTSIAVIDRQADVARIEFEYAKSLVGYIGCESPDEQNGLMIQPGSGSLISPLSAAPAAGPPMVGGAIAIGKLKFGHKGTQFQALFDTLPGQIVKIPFGASSGVLNPPNNIMALNGFANANAEVYQGFIAQGFTTVPSQSAAPTRRFYGTNKNTGAVQGQNTICPVAWNCVGVSVTGGQFIAALNVTFTLQYFMNSPTQGQVGPFNVNDGVIHPLVENCTSIEIFSNAAQVGAAEIPFEITYYLSF